ncbi:MAG: pyridoxamine 5'-phosphate oxidase [Caldilineaceae bacterium]
MSLYLSGLRKEYRRERLDEATAAADPLSMFEEWFAEAAESGLVEPNAMTLATATPEGKPSARVVLLKDFDATGFSFFTNYASRKGQEIAAKSVRGADLLVGTAGAPDPHRGARAEKLDTDESDAHFASRPQGSRLGAWVSHQSAVIPDRAVLEARLADLEAQYGDEAPPRPPYWGGYRVIPAVYEFWQGGLHRLHDRLRYTRRDDGMWDLVRLSP